MTGFRVVGVLPYEADTNDGFFMPVFRRGGTADLWSQLPDLRGLRVEAFAPVRDVDVASLIGFSGAQDCRVGDPLTYCFRDMDAKLHVGNLRDIASVLQRYLEGAADASVRLQVAELIGSGEDVLGAREAFLSVLDRAAGVAVSRSFADTSLFLTALWNSLLKHVSEEGLELLRTSERWVLLDASVHNDTFFGPEVSEWLTSELGINIKKLTDDVRANLRGLVRGPALEDGTLYDALQRALSDIRVDPRQEGRIARLIRRLVENPAIGERLLSIFDEETIFGQKALALLQSVQGRFKAPVTPSFADWIIRNLFSLAYPRQKGVLLFELANHLAPYPAFAVPILARTQHSRSMAVDDARAAIEARLADPSSTPHTYTPSRSDEPRRRPPLRR